MTHQPQQSPGGQKAIETDQDRAGLAWQVGVWDRLSEVYLREVDKRFAPVVEQVVARRAGAGTANP